MTGGKDTHGNKHGSHVTGGHAKGHGHGHGSGKGHGHGHGHGSGKGHTQHHSGNEELSSRNASSPQNSVTSITSRKGKPSRMTQKMEDRRLADSPTDKHSNFVQSLRGLNSGSDYLPLFIHSFIHSSIHSHTHIYIHTHIHTYIHTYIVLNFPLSSLIVVFLFSIMNK